MRVAILSPYPTLPFAQQLRCVGPSYENQASWTVTLANALAKLPDTEVHVLSEATNIPASATVETNGMHVHFIHAPGRFKTLTLWQLDFRRIHRVLDEIQPDIVHGQGLENQYGYATVRCSYPRILTIHGISRLSNNTRMLRRLNRERIVELFSSHCLLHIRHIIVINPFITEALSLRPDIYRLHPIPNAVGPEFFTDSPIPREPDLVVSIGYVDRLKAHELLVRALALLKRRGLNLRAIIAGPVGDDDYTRQLRAYIRRENLAVELVGFLPPEQIHQLLRRASLLVHPSRLETFCMAVAEAMAAGTPVVASRVGGLAHLVSHGKTGLLFEPGNTSELADHMQTLLEDAPLRQRLTDAAAIFARETLHPDRIARLTRAAYEEVLQPVSTERPMADHVRN